MEMPHAYKMDAAAWFASLWAFFFCPCCFLKIANSLHHFAHASVCVCVFVPRSMKRRRGKENSLARMSEISFECRCDRHNRSLVHPGTNSTENAVIVHSENCVCMQLLVLLCFFYSSFTIILRSLRLCMCTSESKSSMHVNCLHDRECPHSFWLGAISCLSTTDIAAKWIVNSKWVSNHSKEWRTHQKISFHLVNCLLIFEAMEKEKEIFWNSHAKTNILRLQSSASNLSCVCCKWNIFFFICEHEKIAVGTYAPMHLQRERHFERTWLLLALPRLLLCVYSSFFITIFSFECLMNIFLHSCSCMYQKICS